MKLRPTEVLLDHKANVSILKPSLLHDVQEADHMLIDQGAQMQVNHLGHFPNSFQLYVSEETKANELSFAEVEDIYNSTYAPRRCFIVHLPDHDICVH